jgi:5-methylcytosine-specific restriction enzyme subunit McrC
MRIELDEYTATRTPVLAPTTSDLALADRLKGEDGRLKVTWLSGGDVEIISTSWVGVVRFSTFDAVVVPKLVGGTLNVLGMLDYATDVDMLRRLPDLRPLPADGTDLLDLICLLLAEETKALIRGGILRSYHVVDDQLTVLRGRLRLREQFGRHYGQLHHLECRFDEYDADVPENQLITLALNRARQLARSPSVKNSVARMYGLMHETCEPLVQELDWYERAIEYDRNNERYRPAHELAKLVLRASGFSDFERFASRLIEEALQGTTLTVVRQSPLRAVIYDDDKDRSYATIAPDLVIQHQASGLSVPIDIKYKTYQDRKISTGDIYQSFLYAYALGRDRTQRRAGVLYPSTCGADGPSLSIRSLDHHQMLGARIAGAGMDVPSALKALASKEQPELFKRTRVMVERLIGISAGEMRTVHSG